MYVIEGGRSCWVWRESLGVCREKGCGGKVLRLFS